MRWYHNLLLWMLCLPLLAFSFTAHADNGASVREEKARLERQLEQSQTQSRRLAESIRKKENEIANLTNELEQLAFQSKQKTAEAGEISERINQATEAMIDISRIPKEMALLHPDANSMTTVEILSNITEQCETLVREYEAEIKSIAQIQENIIAKKKKLTKDIASLQEQQKDLDKKLSERQTLYKQVNTDYKRLEKEAETFKNSSNNTEEFLVKLASVVPEIKPAPIAKPIVTPTTSTNYPIPRMKPRVRPNQKTEKFAKGRLTRPIRGSITKSFSSKHKGIKIRPNKTATVMAPFGGKILFAGKFRDYGNMVIIRHNKTYHSVLAGLTNLNVVIGQQVLSGEPVGDIKRNELYFELRKNSQSVNPKGWFKG